MYRLAGKVIDAYDDIGNKELQANLEKVGDCSLAPVDEVMKLPHDQFALVFLTKTGRAVPKFPIHDASATRISALYFEKNSHKLPPEARVVAASFLKKAAEKFKLEAPKGLDKQAGTEITSNVVDVRKCTEEAPKEAAPKHYALGKSYPIDTLAQVKCACEYFEEHVGNLAPKDRREFAKNASARAADLKVKIHAGSMMAKYAGSAFGALIDCARAERLSLLSGDSDAKKALDHLFEKRSSWKPDEFAAELEKFDVANKLDRYYDRQRGVRDAFRSTFETIKTAGSVKVGNKVITHAQLQGLASSEVLKRTFDTDFCREYASDPVAVFNSLPTPEKVIISSLIEG